MELAKRVRGFDEVAQEHRKTEGVITLPVRGSQQSAGYDFYSPDTFDLHPGEKRLVWTDVKAYMQAGEVLLIDVRSSIGNKKDLMLSNTIGVVDMDYYENPDNDGNIGISLRNLSDTLQTITAGERIAQGIFFPFLPADNGNTETERAGGFGSTGN